MYIRECFYSFNLKKKKTYFCSTGCFPASDKLQSKQENILKCGSYPQEVANVRAYMCACISDGNNEKYLRKQLPYARCC